MAYSIRRMERGDIPQVSRIDREAFPTQWPPPSYHNELQNRMAYYIVAIDDSRPLSDAGPSMPGAPRFRRWSGWWQRIFGKKQAPSSRVQDYIIGFAGIWLMVDEAHITNIAVTREYRGRGIGELLLLATIDLARKLGARIVTLEVRLSNTVAQNLYEKYGFTRAGIRHGYYLDNHEDALIMSTGEIHSTDYQTHLRRLREALSRKLGQTVEDFTIT